MLSKERRRLGFELMNGKQIGGGGGGGGIVYRKRRVSVNTRHEASNSQLTLSSTRAPQLTARPTLPRVLK